MTAGTVVITGGILATVILLLIIAVLCYCRLQVRPELTLTVLPVEAAEPHKHQRSAWDRVKRSHFNV